MAGDLTDLGRLWNDGRVMRWVGYPDGLGIDEAGLGDWLAWVLDSKERHHFVVREPDGRFCGELNCRLDAAGRAALDIKLVPEAQGRGIATRALAWLIATVFRDEAGATLAWTEPRPENVRSRALYARCGLAPEPRPADLEGEGDIWVIRGDLADEDRGLLVAAEDRCLLWWDGCSRPRPSSDRGSFC